MKTLRVILIAPGSGKTCFIKLWRPSAPKLQDADCMREASIIYDAMKTQYGNRWWEQHDVPPRKDEMLKTVIQQSAAYNETDIYITSDYTLWEMSAPEKRAFVMIPFKTHQVYMAERLNRCNGEPVWIDGQLRKLRDFYYRKAHRDGYCYTYTNLIDAYWAIEPRNVGAELSPTV